MNASLLQRQAALGGVALLAAVGALAIGREDGSPAPAREPDAVAPASTWRTAIVGVSQRARGCGERLDESTVGVVHPVLPCGAKVVVEGAGERIATEVVGRRAVGLEHDFDLTPALASRLGVGDSGEIRWRFAE